MNEEETVVEEKNEAVEQSTEVTVPNGGSAMISNDMLNDIIEDENVGHEFSADMLVIPRVGIVQSLSPQRKKDSEAYIEGADEGMIYVRNKVFDGEEGINVIPCKSMLVYKEYEWDGKRLGDLVKHHGESDVEFKKCNVQNGKHINDEGNVILAVVEYFVFVVQEDGSFTRAIISMKNSHLSSAKNWNMDIDEAKAINGDKTFLCRADGSAAKAPIFYYVYNLRAVPVSNDEGSWFKWAAKFVQVDCKNEDGQDDTRPMITMLDFPNGVNLYKEAKEFYKVISENQFRVEEEDTVDETAAEDDESPM